MNADGQYINIENRDVNNKRGDILYYSIEQVANILGEQDSSIRYYTNIFDDILKIEISNKEFRYTNKDIEKLEFLINLKDKGMSIKEIQNYCAELSLDMDDSVQLKQNNSLSIEDFINKIVDTEKDQINNIKSYIDELFEKNQNVIVEKITKILLEEKDKKLESFKNEILSKINEYNKFNIDLYEKLLDKLNILTSDKSSLESDIKLQIDQLSKVFLSREKDLLNEIKRFENIVEQAYYIQQDVDRQKQNFGFIARLFGSK